MKQSMKRKDIAILTGLRRIGKTTLMKLFIERLIKNVKEFTSTPDGVRG
jgi:predicted AAA+ superfamily ATPase